MNTQAYVANTVKAIFNDWPDMKTSSDDALLKSIVSDTVGPDMLFIVDEVYAEVCKVRDLTIAALPKAAPANEVVESIVVTQSAKQVGAATVTATAIIGGSIPIDQLATGADISKLQAVNAEWELLDSITNAALVEKGLNPCSEEGELVRRLIAMFFADPVAQKKYSDMAAANGEIDAEALDADMQAFFTELEKTGHPLIEAGKALKVKRDAAAVEKANAKAARKHAAKPAGTTIKSGEQAPPAFESAMTAAMKNAIAGGDKK